MDTQTVTDLITEVADAVIMPRFRPGRQCSGIKTKPDGSIVTYADTETERILTDTLSADSLHPVLGEEAAAAAGMSTSDAAAYAITQPHLWTVDPLDGSRAFAYGRPHFAVMVGEKVGGTVTRAWVYLPTTRDMFTVKQGVARLNGQPMRPGLSPHAELRGVSYTEPQSPNHRGFLCGRGSGSVGVDYTHLARGVIDFVAHRHPKPWDHLPGVALVKALGGVSATMPNGRILTAADPDTWAIAAQHLTTPTAAFGYQTKPTCTCRIGTGILSGDCGYHQ